MDSNNLLNSKLCGLISLRYIEAVSLYFNTYRYIVSTFTRVTNQGRSEPQLSYLLRECCYTDIMSQAHTSPGRNQMKD